MRIKKPLLALALPALLTIFFLPPAGAFSQNLLVPNNGSILVYSTNGTLLQTISDPNLDIPYSGGIATDSGGNIYVDTYDGSNVVAKFDPNGRLINPNFAVLSTNAYSQNYQLMVDPDGCLYAATVSGYGAQGDSSLVRKYGPNGQAFITFGAAAGYGIVCGTNYGTNDFVYTIQGIDESPTHTAAISARAAGDIYGQWSLLFGSAGVCGLARDNAGNIYALVSGNQAGTFPYAWGSLSSVQKYDEKGNLISSFSVSTNSYGFLAVDNNGNVYVDNVEYPSSNSIYEYDPTGNFVRAIPLTISLLANPFFAIQSPPQLQLNVARSGNQTVAFWTPPLTNYVVQTVTNPASTNWLTVTNGLPVGGFSMTNNSPAAFFRVPGNPAPQVFVLDANNFAIYAYDTNGVLVDASGGYGYSFDQPDGMAVDPGGNLYVSDAQDDAVYEFGPDLSVIGQPFSLVNPGALVFDAAGNLWLGGDPTTLVRDPFDGEFGLTKFNAFGGYILTDFVPPSGMVACGPDGHLYTAGGATLEEFDSRGRLMCSNSAVAAPVDIAADLGGNVYTIDGSGNVYKYDFNLNQITNYHVFDGNSAGGIAVDNSHNLYVVRTDGGFDEYDPNGHPLNGVSGPGSGSFIAVQSGPPLVNIATTGNQTFLYWTPQGTNTWIVQSTTNLASPGWQTRTDAVPCVGLVITNSPPGSIFQLAPAQ